MALPSLRRWSRDKRELTPAGDVWEPFASLRRDMERLFEDFSRSFGGGGAEGIGASIEPRIDVSETETELKVEAELPGVDENDVDVILSDARLTIKGEKKHEEEESKKDYHRFERSYGSFLRSISLPFEVNPDQVKATYDKGVLTITLPKPPEIKAKEKKIPIGKASAAE